MKHYPVTAKTFKNSFDGLRWICFSLLGVGGNIFIHHHSSNLFSGFRIIYYLCIMAAPKGNSFWQLRSKHGRDKLFTSPEILWEAAQEYFKNCEQNPLLEADWVGKDAIEVKKPKMRAFTWAGLELYLDIDSLREYKTNPDYKDFSQVITRIEKIMYEQKFTGAAAGLLHPNIIARDLGLVDKKEIENTVLTRTIEGIEPPENEPKI